MHAVVQDANSAVVYQDQEDLHVQAEQEQIETSVKDDLTAILVHQPALPCHQCLKPLQIKPGTS